MKQAMKEMVELPSLEVLKKCVHVALGTWFSGNMIVIGSRLDLMISEVFSNLNDSMSL